MSEINFAPFFVGQKVICIKRFEFTQMQVNGIYTILNITQCPTCKEWNVNVGLGGGSFCSEWHHLNGKAWMVAEMFAPVQENFQSISLEKVMETETPLISVN